MYINNVEWGRYVVYTSLISTPMRPGQTIYPDTVIFMICTLEINTLRRGQGTRYMYIFISTLCLGTVTGGESVQHDAW